VVKPPSNNVKPLLDVVVGESGMRAIAESLGLAYRSSVALPDELRYYSCVVLENRNALSPKVADHLRRYVAAGGGVVMWGNAPVRIAGRAETSSAFARYNLASISDWLGCSLATKLAMWDKEYGAPWSLDVVVRRPLGFDARPGDVVMSHQGEGDIPVLHRPDEFSQVLCEWSKMAGNYPETNAIGAMAHQYGRGRVYWQCVPADPNYPDLAGLLRCGVAWAAGVPSPGGRHMGGPVENTARPQQGGSSGQTSDLVDILRKVLNK
jgi:hypothetical protein